VPERPQPPERFAYILEERSREVGLTLPPHAERLLARYLAELDVWRRRFNLTGPLSSEELADHSLESVPASPLDLIPEGARVADIGSGAGFPAIPLAILRPDTTFTLFEPTGKKTTFLSHVTRELPLANVRIELRRIEDARGETFPVATVRGVGSLGRHVGKAGFLAPGGRLLAWTTDPEGLARELPRFHLVREIPIPASDRKRIAAFERLPAG
jgi:16S rRNA (guanine527-N7)-methyltransferase